MSLKVLTAEYMLSNVNGLGVAKNWLPRVVQEAFLQSTKDGDIKISPDPVTMITGDLAWYNNTADPQEITVLVHRAPRAIIAQNPTTIVIHDAWTSLISPIGQSADYPSVYADTFGGRLQIDRPDVDPDNLQYGRYFLNGDDSQAYVYIGVVPPSWSFNFNYLAAVQTPGIWIQPGASANFDGRWEADANWTRLLALANPVAA